MENYQDGGQHSARGKAGLKIRRQKCGRLSGIVFQAPRQPIALPQANFEIVQESQRPLDLDNDQATAREGWDNANHNLFSILYFTTSGPAFSVVRRFEGKTRKDGAEHRQDAWAALREKFDDCSREVLQAAHREMETVKMGSDEHPDEFVYKKDRGRDRLNSVTPKEAPSDRRYEDIIL